MRKIDLTDQRFGRLVVRKEAGRDKGSRLLWLCECDCGIEKIISSWSLRCGRTSSCGCLSRELASRRRKGIPLSEETKKKLSKSHIGRFIGTDHSNWNPNITDEERVAGRHIPGYKEWRTLVYERDLYKCQICGDSKGGNLISHHLESYNSNPELRTAVLNGITLCEDCHKEFHHFYGYGDNTKEQFEEFKMELIN